MRRRIELGCLYLITWALVTFIIWWLFYADIKHAWLAQSDPLDTLHNETYSVVYDPALRIPVAADWELTSDYLGKTSREPSWRFAEDKRVPKPRARHEDYTNSGYDRGHMCPAADRSKNTDMMKETFIMTNVCPQLPALNRGAWKRLEDRCRNMVRNGQSLRVHVDAVFWPTDLKFIGRDSVAVPHGFVKTIRDYKTDTICYSQYFQN